MTSMRGPECFRTHGQLLHHLLSPHQTVFVLSIPRKTTHHQTVLVRVIRLSRTRSRHPWWEQTSRRSRSRSSAHSSRRCIRCRRNILVVLQCRHAAGQLFHSVLHALDGVGDGVHLVVDFDHELLHDLHFIIYQSDVLLQFGLVVVQRFHHIILISQDLCQRGRDVKRRQQQHSGALSSESDRLACPSSCRRALPTQARH